MHLCCGNPGGDRVRRNQIPIQCDDPSRSHATRTGGIMSADAGHVAVAIIGGGQAGLSVSWYLEQAGVDHVVLEAQTPVHAWADTRWDNFTLVTPNWHCKLPGYAYEGDDPDGFMTRDEVVDWLDGWLHTFTPPLLTQTRVTKLRPLASGGFELRLQTAAGDESL